MKFSILISEFSLLTCIFTKLRGFELVTSWFEIVTRGFELCSWWNWAAVGELNSELANVNLQVITRVLFFHVSSEYFWFTWGCALELFATFYLLCTRRKELRYYFRAWRLTHIFQPLIKYYVFSKSNNRGLFSLFKLNVTVLCIIVTMTKQF